MVTHGKLQAVSLKFSRLQEKEKKKKKKMGPKKIKLDPPPIFFEPLQKQIFGCKKKWTLPQKKLFLTPSKKKFVKKKLYRGYYLQRLRDSVSPVCGIF